MMNALGSIEWLLADEESCVVASAPEQTRGECTDLTRLVHQTHERRRAKRVWRSVPAEISDESSNPSR
jgi:hypothetical protein